MEIYLEPRDVAAADTRKVLDFLNAARSPEEIAAAVEFPGELDVGVRVGARLLARRDELGTFTSLQQVVDVPQVGPERFTEIVVAITGLWIRHSAEGARGPAVAGLEQEVAELRAALAALQAGLGRPVITLRPLVDSPFLGEPVPLVVEVLDGTGKPDADAPVNLASSWGSLRGSTGDGVVEGAAITLRTDIFGRAAATFTPPASEDLQAPQQAALETSLAALDHDAPTPLETWVELQELGRQYRWEAAGDLRRAVDIYIRDFRPRLLETVNFRDYAARWTYFESAVTAAAVFESSVVAAATLTVHLKDWLGAWLEAYLQLVEKDADLLARLRAESKKTTDAGQLLAGVNRRVRDFIDGQWGMTGAYIGERVAERSMLEFLGSDVPELPLEARLKLHPALTTQASTVAGVGVTAFAAIEQARTSVRAEIRDPREVIDPGLIDSRVQLALDSRLKDFEAGQDAKLEQRLAPLDAQLANKADARELTTVRVELLGSLRQVTTRVGDLERRIPPR
jgi:hypothetical protein